MSMEGKRWSIYVRCSSEEQAKEGYSIEMQISKCTKFITTMTDAVVYKTYSDEGVSATDPLEKRKGLMELFVDAQDRKFDCIAVMASDRLIRMSEHDQHIFYALMKYDIEVRTCSNEILTDNSPMGDFMRKIRIAISELEVKLLSFRVKGAMQIKAENGEWKGGIPSYGFEWNQEKKFMEPIPDRIEQVKLIYKMYVEEKKGVMVIRDFLNSSRNLYQAENGPEEWNKGRVYGVLKSPMYCGWQHHNMRYSKFEIQNHKKFKDKKVWEIYPVHYVTPVITKEMWDMAQEIKNKRADKLITINTSKTSWLLTGIIYCGSCGGPLQGHPIINKHITKKGELREYDCSNYLCTHKVEKGKNYCNARQVTKKQVEKTVMIEVAKFIDQLSDKYDGLTKKHIDKLLANLHKKEESDYSRLELEMQQLKRKIDKYYQDYENELITAEVLTPAIQRLNIQLETVNNRMVSMKEQKNTDQKMIKEILQYKEQLKEWKTHIFLSDKDIPAKKLMLTKVLNYVEVVNKQGIIYYNFDFKTPPFSYVN